MSRIAYFYREMSEYIDIDLRALAREHEVTVTTWASRWPQPLRTWQIARTHDVGMSWFASWHALLPALCFRMMGKPFVLTVGGYDTACLPGIDYGHQRGGFKSLIARAVMNLATHVVGISDFTMRELQVLGVDAHKCSLVPLGLDPARYAPSAECEGGLLNAERESALVITTGGVNRSNLTRKGLETFVRAAALLPEAHFVLVGPWMDDAAAHLQGLATSNVTLTGKLSHADKVAMMWRADVVVQASQHEAFGLSLAESMLCGAAPVVTNAGALPWVAGDTGVVVESQEPAAVAAGVRAALAHSRDAGARARSRVLAEFTLERRAAALEALLAQATGNSVPTLAASRLAA
jgi:glycosyltransferase involved in cell wall biosynthesis